MLVRKRSPWSSSIPWPRWFPKPKYKAKWGQPHGASGPAHVPGLVQAHRRHQQDQYFRGTINQLRESRRHVRKPEVTTGGRALKFYKPVRLDVRRIETIKTGDQMIRQPDPGQRSRNRGAPFKMAEFDITWPRHLPTGMCWTGRRGPSWRNRARYSHKGNRIGQEENVKIFRVKIRPFSRNWKTPSWQNTSRPKGRMLRSCLRWPTWTKTASSWTNKPPQPFSLQGNIV